MNTTDPIADMLTRIRNANNAKHESVEIPASNMKKQIAQILVDEGYIKSFNVIDDGKQDVIKVFLKYGPNKSKVLQGLVGTQTYLEARPSYLRRKRGNPPGHERPRCCDCLDFQGRYDRQSGKKRKCRRRSPRIRLVKK